MPNLVTIVVAGATCGCCYLVEKIANSDAFAHGAAAVICGTCGVVGLKLSYDSAKKAADLLKKPVAEGAKKTRKEVQKHLIIRP